MSKISLLACVAVATAMTTSTFALTPTGRDTGTINFGGVGENLNAWHLALYAGTSTRKVENNHNLDIDIDFKRFNMVLGCDLTRWMTVYGLVGMMKANSDSWGEDNDRANLFGVGVWANLMESDQLSLFTDVSTYRVNTGAEYSFAAFDDFSWSQLDAFLTFELVNELNECPFILPETVGLFFGPIISYIISDDYEATSGNTVGITLGVSMMFTDDTYATLAGDFYSDDSSVYGMVGVRF